MNKIYDKTEFLKYMNKRAKELYSSSELNYWDCYYALQTMNRCIAEILENGDSVNIYKWWDIKPKLFKSIGEDGTREVKKVIWEALGKMLLNI